MLMFCIWMYLDRQPLLLESNNRLDKRRLRRRLIEPSITAFNMGWGVELWDKQAEIEKRTQDGIDFIANVRTLAAKVCCDAASTLAVESLTAVAADGRD